MTTEAGDNEPTGPPPLPLQPHDWLALDEIINRGGYIRSQELRFSRSASAGRLIRSGLLWIPPHSGGIIEVSPHVAPYLFGRAAQSVPEAANPYDPDADPVRHHAWNNGHDGRIHTPNEEIPCFPNPTRR